MHVIPLYSSQIEPKRVNYNHQPPERRLCVYAPGANLSLTRCILYLLIVQILKLLLQFAFGMADVTC